MNYSEIKSHMDSLSPSRKVRLLAVSKGQSAQKIRDLYKQGQLEFAENYIDELRLKRDELKDLPIKFVYIGALQSRKIEPLVSLCDEIQSVASKKHLEFLSKACQKLGKTNFPYFIQINFWNEPQKSGVLEHELESLLTTTQEGLSLQGLMVIPPEHISASCNVSSPSSIDSYIYLKKLAQNVGLGKLSLGMSHDYPCAILAGSDCVRIGTKLFGPRAFLQNSKDEIRL